MKRRMNFCILALLLLTICDVARADIVFDSGNDPGGTANVLFNTGADIIGPAETVRGHLPTGEFVDVSSSELLLFTGGGQAAIQAVDPGGFEFAEIFLSQPSGGVFTKIVFALSGKGTGQDGEAPFSITVTESDGSDDTEYFTTGSGNNFYTVVAINNQDIRKVSLKTTGTVEFDSIKQLRIGGIELTAVPEPATILGLGTVLCLLGSRLRRKKA